MTSRLGQRGAYRILAREAEAWFARSVVEPARNPRTVEDEAVALALGPPRARPRPSERVAPRPIVRVPKRRGT